MIPLRSIVAFVLWSTFLHAAPAQPPRDPLAVLIEYGLPDVRGAQRVSVEYSVHQDTFGDPPGPDRKREKQNCWLLHEEPGGRLTLLMKEVRVVYGQRMTREQMEKRDEQPGALGEIAEMIVTPVDLQAELKAMGNGGKPRPKPARSRPQADADAVKPREMFGSEMLLLMAHLQQRRQPGVSALVARMFPARTLPDLLDDSWQLLADGRLETAADRWIETGDAAAYTADLEALLKDAPRAWEKRAAVRALADHAQEAARQPLENEAAEVLVNLRTANLVQLPLDQHWLLPEPKEPPLWLERDAVTERQLSWYDRTIWVTPEAEAAAAQTPVAAFFRRRFEAAQMLLPLLKSRRPTRLVHSGSEPLWTEPSVGFQFDGRADIWPDQSDSRARPLKESYDGLYRTYEVRELAYTLLESMLPSYIGYRSELEPRLTKWLRKLEGQNEEGIAWKYIEGCEQPNDAFFGPALALLVERRPAESAERLRNLLCDPMIWSWSLVQKLAPLLPAYLDALGTGRKAFVDDLLAAVNFGIESRPDGPSDSEGEWGRSIRWSKDDGVRAMKLMRLLTEQPTPIGLVNRFATLQDAEADGAFDALSIFARGHFDRELQARLFQTAARLPERRRRLQLLEVALHFGGTIQPGPPMDEATRAAIATLLADESDQEYGLGYPRRPAEYAQSALLHPRISPEQNAHWESFRRESERLAAEWLPLAIAAAEDGQALPPIPDGPAFTVAEIAEFAARWKDLSGLEVLTAFHALPPASQLRLMRGLGSATTWAAPFVRAQLTVVSVPDDEPELRKLIGRAFDPKFHDEMGALVRAAAAEGRGLELTLQTDEVLSGIRLIVTGFTNPGYWRSREDFGALRLPGLGKRPRPDYEVRETARRWRAYQFDQRGPETLAPGWKDRAITDAWQREFGGRAVRAKSAGDALVSDPPALAAFLARVRQGAPKYLIFENEINASPLVDR